MQDFIKLRRQVHKYPQYSGNQQETVKRITRMALQIGVKQESIRLTQNPTHGLWIDLSGEAQPSGNTVCVALRADIDALEMTEQNHHLEHRSTIEGVAHTCGHDGHLATLLATIPSFLEKLKKVPSNKTVRLIFQPSEEDIQPHKGAREMIKQGCLEGVDQVYGFHNINIGAPFGYFSCREGVIMSASTSVKIKIRGTGGHASSPQLVKFSLPKAVRLYEDLTKFAEELALKGHDFTAVFPVFHSGQRFNVISQTALLQGNLRTFSTEIRQTIISKIQSELSAIRQQGFETQLQVISGSLTENHKQQVQHVVRVAQQLFGKEMVGKTGLPTRASEDFGEYTKVVPGAFFFVSGHDQLHHSIPHNANYDFNDQLIPLVSSFWVALTLDRFRQL